MDLKKAITRAATLAKTGDWAFLDRNAINVVSSDFQAVLILDLDTNLQKAFNPKDVAKIVRSWKVPQVQVLESQSAGTFGLLGMNKNGDGLHQGVFQSPPIPMPNPPLPLQNLVPVPEWDVIARTFHAAGVLKEDTLLRPELGNVCFGVTATAATDESSIAVAEVGIGQGQMFRATGFTKWPKGDVEVFLDHTRGWFKVGDEVRIMELHRGWFPPLPKLLQESPKTYADFDLKMVTQAVDSLVKTKVRSLRLHGTGTPPFTLTTYPNSSGQVRMLTPLQGKLGEVDMFLDGKRLLAALKSTTGPVVRLGYGDDPMAPLRIESDKFHEDVYPLREV